MKLVQCRRCNGSEQQGGQGDAGSADASVDCHDCVCGKSGPRFFRLPSKDRRIGNGDDFAGDAWIDRKTGAMVYGAVGRDRNTDIVRRTL